MTALKLDQKRLWGIGKVWLMPLTACLVSCGGGDLPEGMAGTYSRYQTLAAVPVPTRYELNLTNTGISITGMSLNASQDIKVGGTSVLGGSIKAGPAGSALFSKLKCKENVCTFSTKNDCEGTLTKEGDGSLVVIAMGECQEWSGKWKVGKGDEPPVLPSSSASASASASASTAPADTPPTPLPKADPTVTPSATASASPTATATATASASTAPSGPPKLGCMTACNDASIACIRDCKVGDLSCMKDCADKAAQCSQKCD
ncbi:MAG: hypothetical protein IPK82_26165 [Polyangiaceae bacterium]|nr:hypothetical protein [Polyangiaceae bacterium]